MLLYPGYISENPAGNKIRYKPDMTPGVNINSRKATVASINRVGGPGGTLSSSAGDLGKFRKI